jgi:phospholipid/cholesterol/gamma-HCH transport system substrate-binding protein
MQEVKKDIKNVSEAATKFQKTADAITNTATVATEQINSISEDFRKTSGEINILASNLNNIIDSNKTSINDAIISLSETTREVGNLAKDADSLIGKIDKSLTENDVKNLVANLEKATNNFEKISNNLLALSTEINNPANLVTLQQTLDSARVTFANTAKITSDLDQLTGDPKFRSNVRKLVNGLSDLISYTELLEKQVQLAIILDSAQQITTDNSTIKFSQFKPTSPTNLNQLKTSNNLSFEQDNLK